MHFEVVGEVPEVRVDEQAILLAIINLLDNAVKYGGNDGPVELSSSWATAATWTCAYGTAGPGIPQRGAARVFERFYRVREHAQRREARGSGCRS